MFGAGVPLALVSCSSDMHVSLSALWRGPWSPVLWDKDTCRCLQCDVFRGHPSCETRTRVVVCTVTWSMVTSAVRQGHVSLSSMWRGPWSPVLWDKDTCRCLQCDVVHGHQCCETRTRVVVCTVTWSMVTRAVRQGHVSLSSMWRGPWSPVLWDKDTCRCLQCDVVHGHQCCETRTRVVVCTVTWSMVTRAVRQGHVSLSSMWRGPWSPVLWDKDTCRCLHCDVVHGHPSCETRTRVVVCTVTWSVVTRAVRQGHVSLSALWRGPWSPVLWDKDTCRCLQCDVVHGHQCCETRTRVVVFNVTWSMVTSAVRQGHVSLSALWRGPRSPVLWDKDTCRCLQCDVVHGHQCCETRTRVVVFNVTWSTVTSAVRQGHVSLSSMWRGPWSPELWDKDTCRCLQCDVVHGHQCCETRTRVVVFNVTWSTVTRAVRQGHVSLSALWRGPWSPVLWDKDTCRCLQCDVVHGHPSCETRTRVVVCTVTWSMVTSAVRQGHVSLSSMWRGPRSPELWDKDTCRCLHCDVVHGHQCCETRTRVVVFNVTWSMVTSAVRQGHVSLSSMWRGPWSPVLWDKDTCRCLQCDVVHGHPSCETRTRVVVFNVTWSTVTRAVRQGHVSLSSMWRGPRSPELWDKDTCRCLQCDVVHGHQCCETRTRVVVFNVTWSMVTSAVRQGHVSLSALWRGPWSPVLWDKDTCRCLHCDVVHGHPSCETRTRVVVCTVTWSMVTSAVRQGHVSLSSMWRGPRSPELWDKDTCRCLQCDVVHGHQCCETRTRVVVFNVTWSMVTSAVRQGHVSLSALWRGPWSPVLWDKDTCRCLQCDVVHGHPSCETRTRVVVCTVTWSMVTSAVRQGHVSLSSMWRGPRSPVLWDKDTCRCLQCDVVHGHPSCETRTRVVVFNVTWSMVTSAVRQGHVSLSSMWRGPWSPVLWDKDTCRCLHCDVVHGHQCCETRTRVVVFNVTWSMVTSAVRQGHVSLSSMWRVPWSPVLWDKDTCRCLQCDVVRGHQCCETRTRVVVFNVTWSMVTRAVRQGQVSLSSMWRGPRSPVLWDKDTCRCLQCDVVHGHQCCETRTRVVVCTVTWSTVTRAVRQGHVSLSALWRGPWSPVLWDKDTCRCLHCDVVHGHQCCETRTRVVVFNVTWSMVTSAVRQGHVSLSSMWRVPWSPELLDKDTCRCLQCDVVHGHPSCETRTRVVVFNVTCSMVTRAVRQGHVSLSSMWRGPWSPVLWDKDTCRCLQCDVVHGHQCCETRTRVVVFNVTWSTVTRAVRQGHVSLSSMWRGPWSPELWDKDTCRCLQCDVVHGQPSCETRTRVVVFNVTWSTVTRAVRQGHVSLSSMWRGPRSTELWDKDTCRCLQCDVVHGHPSCETRTRVVVFNVTWSMVTRAVRQGHVSLSSMWRGPRSTELWDKDTCRCLQCDVVHGQPSCETRTRVVVFNVTWSVVNRAVRQRHVSLSSMWRGPRSPELLDKDTCRCLQCDVFHGHPSCETRTSVVVFNVTWSVVTRAVRQGHVSLSSMWRGPWSPVLWDKDTCRCLQCDVFRGHPSCETRTRVVVFNVTCSVVTRAVRQGHVSLSALWRGPRSPVLWDKDTCRCLQCDVVHGHQCCETRTRVVVFNVTWSTVTSAVRQGHVSLSSMWRGPWSPELLDKDTCRCLQCDVVHGHQCCETRTRVVVFNVTWSTVTSAVRQGHVSLSSMWRGPWSPELLDKDTCRCLQCDVVHGHPSCETRTRVVVFNVTWSVVNRAVRQGHVSLSSMWRGPRSPELLDKDTCHCLQCDVFHGHPSCETRTSVVVFNVTWSVVTRAVRQGHVSLSSMWRGPRSPELWDKDTCRCLHCDVVHGHPSCETRTRVVVFNVTWSTVTRAVRQGHVSLSALWRGPRSPELWDKDTCRCLQCDVVHGHPSCETRTRVVVCTVTWSMVTSAVRQGHVSLSSMWRGPWSPELWDKDTCRCLQCDVVHGHPSCETRTRVVVCTVTWSMVTRAVRQGHVSLSSMWRGPWSPELWDKDTCRCLQCDVVHGHPSCETRTRVVVCTVTWSMVTSAVRQGHVSLSSMWRVPWSPELWDKDTCRCLQCDVVHGHPSCETRTRVVVFNVTCSMVTRAVRQGHVSLSSMWRGPWSPELWDKDTCRCLQCDVVRGHPSCETRTRVVVCTVTWSVVTRAVRQGHVSLSSRWRVPWSPELWDKDTCRCLQGDVFHGHPSCETRTRVVVFKVTWSVVTRAVRQGHVSLSSMWRVPWSPELWDKDKCRCLQCDVVHGHPSCETRTRVVVCTVTWSVVTRAVRQGHVSLSSMWRGPWSPELWDKDTCRCLHCDVVHGHQCCETRTRVVVFNVTCSVVTRAVSKDTCRCLHCDVVRGHPSCETRTRVVVFNVTWSMVTRAVRQGHVSLSSMWRGPWSPELWDKDTCRCLHCDVVRGHPSCETRTRVVVFKVTSSMVTRAVRQGHVSLSSRWRVPWSPELWDKDTCRCLQGDVFHGHPSCETRTRVVVFNVTCSVVTRAVRQGHVSLSALWRGPWSPELWDKDTCRCLQCDVFRGHPSCETRTCVVVFNVTCSVVTRAVRQGHVSLSALWRGPWSPVLWDKDTCRCLHCDVVHGHPSCETRTRVVVCTVTWSMVTRAVRQGQVSLSSMWRGPWSPELWDKDTCRCLHCDVVHGHQCCETRTRVVVCTVTWSMVTRAVRQGHVSLSALWRGPWSPELWDKDKCRCLQCDVVRGHPSCETRTRVVVCTVTWSVVTRAVRQGHVSLSSMWRVPWSPELWDKDTCRCLQCDVVHGHPSCETRTRVVVFNVTWSMVTRAVRQGHVSLSSMSRVVYTFRLDMQCRFPMSPQSTDLPWELVEVSSLLESGFAFIVIMDPHQSSWLTPMCPKMLM